MRCRYMNNSFAFGAGPRLEISITSWYLQPSQSDLPEQLRPHQVNRVEGESAPATVRVTHTHTHTHVCARARAHTHKLQ